MNIQLFPCSIGGRLCAPPSKSMAHRSVLAAALAEQLSRRAGEGLETAAIFFSNQYGILGRTALAGKLAAHHPCKEEST